MPNDRDTREVFLGPTTQETDEFYAYQRDNPGKDKSEYLAWFEEKFGKEIELRRRRSDQPSDLEYMVIKKRSKYRERIGLESEKLLAYYEANPKKTYRALKRNRLSTEGGGDSPPEMTGPPPAKRGRRSYGSANTNASSAGGPPQSSMPTFSVDISNRPPPESEGHTPRSRPETPQIPADIAPHPGRMTQDGLKIEPKPQNIQPAAYPARIRSAIPPESPSPLPTEQTAPHPLTPMWNPVNPSPSNFAAKGGKIAAKSERPSTVPPSSHKESQPQISPARPNPPPRILRSNSLTKGSAPPVPVLNGNVPPPLESSEFRVPVQRHPAEDEMNLEGLRARLQEVVSKKAQLHDEAGLLETEIANNERMMLTRQFEMDVRRFEAGYQSEIMKAQSEYEQLQQWSSELSRGNLQLQTIKTQLEDDNRRLQEDKNSMAIELQRMEAKLNEVMGQSKEPKDSRSPTPKSSQSTMLNTGEPSLKEKMEIGSWLTTKFANDAEKEEKLKRLVEDLNKAGWKDLEDRVQELVGFVNDMGAERQRQQSQWALKLFVNGEIPPMKSDTEKEITPPPSTNGIIDETSPAQTPSVEQETRPSPKAEPHQPNSPESKITPEAAKIDADSNIDTEMKD
jgi:hypothetical protein